MTLKVPIFKNHFFLLSMVLAFFLILPVSATNYYPTWQSGIPLYSGESFDPLLPADHSNPCNAAYGAGWSTSYNGDSYFRLLYINQVYNSGGIYDIGTGSVPPFDTSYSFLSSFGCSNGVDFRYVPKTWVQITAGSRPAPSISVSGSPSSGTNYISTISISGLTQFDTVTFFNITAPNSSVYSLSSPSSPISIDSEGTWTIRATATNTGGSSTATGYVYGNTVYAPVASFSCSPLNTTAPDTITCTDESTHLPTSWLWSFDSLGVQMTPGSDSGGIYYSTNTTQNPVFSVAGSGVINARLEASNEFGSSFIYKPAYITVSGVAPTPTPTPNIPWPNQTGICWRSGISLGSQETRAFLVHYQLTNPQGDTFSGQYNIGQENLVSNYPFFTALLGQYIYNEYSMVDGSLLWRQSYIVEDCTVTPTPTGTYIPPTPTVTYTIPVTYPTVTIPTGTYVIPTGTITIPPTGGTVTPVIPVVIPTIPDIANETTLYAFTIEKSPMSKPIVDFVKVWEDNIVLGPVGGVFSIVSSPITFLTSGLAQSMVQTMGYLVAFASFPFLFFYVFIAIIHYLPSKVIFAAALVLWVNNLFFLYDRYQGKYRR